MDAILLLLESRLLRDSLRLILSNVFSVITETEEITLSAIMDRQIPDLTCTIIDTVTYGENIDTINVLKANGCKIVILADETDILEMNAEQIVSADGILSHKLSAEAVVRCLRLVCAGERVVPRDLVAAILARGSPAATDGAESRSAGKDFTRRELEVLAHLIGGNSNKAIGRLLGMTEATVKVHFKNLLRKTNAQNRTQAAIWALSNLPDLTRHLGSPGAVRSRRTRA